MLYEVITSLWAAEKLDWIEPSKLAFTLREGLTWTNGYGPVTAEDVKFSYQTLVRDGHPSYRTQFV